MKTHPPELNMYVSQLISNLEQAKQMLDQSEPDSKPLPGTLSRVIQRVNSAMFYLYGLQAFAAYEDDADAFVQDVSNRLAVADKELQVRYDQLVEMELSTGSLSRYFALRVLSGRLRVAKSEMRPPGYCLLRTNRPIGSL